MLDEKAICIEEVNVDIKPKVSVIMCVYNEQRHIGEAIDSVLNQTFKNYELIIVDDGSVDSTAKLAKEYVNKYPDKIRYFYQENQGPSEARNNGIQEARGAYIAILDSDDIALPLRLEKQVSFLDKNPPVALLGTGAYIINENGRIINKDSPLADNNTIKEKLLDGNHFFHSSVMFRKKCVEQVGAYRVELNNVEDYDLWLRISEHFGVANLADFLVKYRINSKSITVRNKLRQDKLTDIVKDMAKERRMYGLDKLQKGERVVLNTDYCSPRKSSAIVYFEWARLLYNQAKYSESFDYLLKAIYNDLFNREQLKYLFFNFFTIFIIWRGIRKITKAVLKFQQFLI